MGSASAGPVTGHAEGEVSMFSFVDAEADVRVVGSMSATDLGESGRDLLRLSRQAEARVVLAAGALGERTYRDVLATAPPIFQMMMRHKADKAAVAEVSLQLGISRSKAGRWMSLAELLEAVPTIRAAYLDGELSTNRVDIMARAASRAPKTADDDADTDTDGTDAGVSFEDVALELGLRASTDPVLRDQLEEVLISLDPQASAQERDAFDEAFAQVSITNDAVGHVNIEACVPAQVGVFLRDRIAALIGLRVCRNDRRTLGQQRVAALAELTGVPGAHLSCTCGRDGCARATKDPDTEPVDETAAETPADAAEAAELDSQLPAPTDADAPPADGDALSESDAAAPIVLPSPMITPDAPAFTLVADSAGVVVPR
ncbi:HNH endonuclease, partial [Gordonia sp. DT30]|uniref:HNH endonuclease n=1 Tax=Gordonia sp. DT30 TaxID=3416546 RepID=UPI003CEEDF44